MVEYGYIGGSNLIALGSREYVQSFFKAIDKYVFSEELYRRLDWSLITDRLYKRTISDDMLDVAIGTMARMLYLMEFTSLSSVKWKALGLNGPEDGPEVGANANLSDFYRPFGTGLIQCATSEIFYTLDEPPLPAFRIGLTTVPRYIIDRARPAEEYEALGPKDLPFWLRDDIDYPEIPVFVMDGNNPE